MRRDSTKRRLTYVNEEMIMKLTEEWKIQSTMGGFL